MFVYGLPSLKFYLSFGSYELPTTRIMEADDLLLLPLTLQVRVPKGCSRVRFLAMGWSHRRRHPRFNRVLLQHLVQALWHLVPKSFTDPRAPSCVANDTSSP